MNDKAFIAIAVVCLLALIGAPALNEPIDNTVGVESAAIAAQPVLASEPASVVKEQSGACSTQAVADSCVPAPTSAEKTT